MAIVVTQGLRISTSCGYLKFTEGEQLNIDNNVQRDVIEITFPKGFKSSDIVSNRISLIYDCILKDTDFIRISNPLIDINGMVFRKLTPYPLRFSQFLVRDIDEFMVGHEDNHISILIPEKYKTNLNYYIDCIKSIPEFQYVKSDELCGLTNYFGIILRDKDIRIDSTNIFPYTSSRHYTQYLLNYIDVLYSFLSHIRKFLEPYGIQLLRSVADERLRTSNHLIYSFSDLNKQESHKDYDFPLQWWIKKITKVQFELTVTDMLMYTDFITKYQNIDFISNLTEFYTPDKNGVRWISFAKWGEIDTAFDRSFQQDSNSNISYIANFECELYYYECYDKDYPIIKDIIINMLLNYKKGYEGHFIEDKDTKIKHVKLDITAY